MSEYTIIKSDAPDELDPPDNLTDETSEETSEEAPYGYKADGTPRKKPGRKAGSGGGGGSSGGSRKSLESLREPLTQRLIEYFGGPLVLVSPIAAEVWQQRADSTADALITLATRSPRWRKYIERLIMGSSGADLGITFVGVATGMLVDAGRVAPDGKVARFYGIDQIYADLYGAYEAGASDIGSARGLYAEVS